MMIQARDIKTEVGSSCITRLKALRLLFEFGKLKLGQAVDTILIAKVEMWWKVFKSHIVRQLKASAQQASMSNRKKVDLF